MVPAGILKGEVMENDLLSLLLDMRNGQVASDINAKFNEVMDAVLTTGGKGELTVKLFFKPSKLAMGGAVVEVETEHQCKLKKPELEIGRSFFFVTKEGKLTRDDPSQTAMFESQQQKAAEEHTNGRRTQ